MSRTATLIALLLLASITAGAASAQAPAPTSTPGSASKPVAQGASNIRPGTYDLDVAFGGGVIPGTLQLSAVGDSLVARLHVGEHDPPVRSITRKGVHLLVDAGGEGMELAYDFQFDGDAVSGTFKFNGDAGLVTGKRRK